MDFQELEGRLLDYLRRRIRNGELTERQLATITGISQPHVHNVLKGKRMLSMELADTILHILRIDLLDLFTAEEKRESLSRDG